MAAQDKVQQLRQLIHARAAEKQMLQADLEVLDEQELEMLVQNKLITNNILCDTTEGQLVVAGVTLGAAKVLKTAFPGPSAGVGLTGSSGAGAAGGVAEVLHELDIVKKQLQQQQFLMTKTATYSMLGVITALYPQPSQLSGGRDRRFREKLINYYKSNKQGGLMLCTVLGQYVESDAIVAGHLFPTRRAVLAEQFGIRQQDVNNARNGLLWCQCIEYAFELMKVTIAPGPLPGQFTFHVVDDALRNTPLCQHAGECKGSSYLQALEGKTYRDLDGTLLTFPSECPADHRPMERAVLAHFMVSVSLHRGTDSILPAGLQAVVQNCKVHSPMAQQAATLSWLQATCSVQPDTSVESAEAVWHSAPVPLGVGAEGEPDLTWSETEDEE